MKKGLYGKLALMGMKKNKESYLPFILASMCIIALFYINLVLTRSEELKSLGGMNHLQPILGMGLIITGVFSVIFLFYTNNFLMKRRRQEFALYNVLGMEKRHLSKVLFWENFYLAAITILAGLFFGAVFYKLVEGFLFKVIEINLEGSYLPLPLNLLITAALFLFIYGLIYLNSLWQLRKATPSELFREARAADAVPKVNWLVALLGAVCLGGGYYLALTVPSPLQALQKFTFAVFLVMVGTYFGFMALSLLVLKVLQNKKNYYYKTKNFTAVSGLIFRMKQNAMGLANICILSTAVLVVLSSATALHLGIEESIQNAYPREVILTGEDFSEEIIAKEKEKVQAALAAQGFLLTRPWDFAISLSWVKKVLMVSKSQRGNPPWHLLLERSFSSSFPSKM